MNFRIYSALLCFALLIGDSAFAQTAEQNTFLRHVERGAEQLKDKDFTGARNSFEEALRYNDRDPGVYFGLGMAYFHLKDDRRAERELRRAIDLQPDAPGPYQVLGELYYRKDEIETAIHYWEQAVQRAPTDNAAQARLERIRKEHGAEKDFNRDVTSHFLVKYEGREKIEAGRIVLRILEDAYGEIGRALSHYPSHEIQVILYSDQQFQDVTDAPAWSTGLYDGKIRFPIGGIERETPGLRRLLYHEYTHAVIRAMTPRAPAWLHEGLAQHFERKVIGHAEREALRRIARAGKLPPLASLEGSFTGLGNEQAAYAYLFSLSLVRYLIDDFGMYRVITVLDALAAGDDTPKAVGRAVLSSIEEFERGWRRSLE